jgi:hypothetical protein
MNKWKIGFWICFVLLLATLGLGLYSIIDQGVTLTYMRQGYKDTEDDLKGLIKMINETDLTKGKIKDLVTTDNELRYLSINGDTITLSRVTLIFKDNKLNKVERTW